MNIQRNTWKLLIPQPMHMEERQSSFQLSEKTSFRSSYKADIPAGEFHRRAINARDFLKQSLQKQFGISCTGKNQKERPSNIIDFIIDKERVAETSKKIRPDVQDNNVKEAYIIEIDRMKIEITAATEHGLYYGVQTILQALALNKIEQKTAHITVPAIYIFDQPRFQYRGFMLDSVRHFLSIKFIKHFINIMAMLKMNVFHWHLSDDQGFRMEIPALPELTRVSSCLGDDASVHGFYSKADIRTVVRYAVENGITVIPEIDVPGHSFSIISAYPDLCCTGKPIRNKGHQKDILCAGKEKVITFLEKLFSEVSSQFPGRYLHIGGDEAPKDRWNECPLCRSAMKKKNLKNTEELQSDFTVQVSQLLKNFNKTPVAWEEVLEAEAPLPKDLVVQWWRHRTKGNWGIKKALQKEHAVIASPNSYFYLNFPERPDENFTEKRTSTIDKIYCSNDFINTLTNNDRQQLSGGEICIWTEYLQDHDIIDHIFPRAYAAAEILWSLPDNRDVEFLLQRAEFLSNATYFPFHVTERM